MHFGDEQVGKLWVSLGFLCLTLVGFLGILMRSLPFIELPIPFFNILHAHSHTALLGWAFIMATAAIINIHGFNYKDFRVELGLVSFATVGMFLSFLYQSYGVISISFSTLFVLSSYALLYKLYKQIDTKTSSANLFKWGIVWYYVSTLGIWCIAPVVAFFGKNNEYYHLTIQFFLHFQINAWLVYIALGILFHHFKIKLNKHYLTGLNFALFLSYAVHLFWLTDLPIFFIAYMLGVLIQLIFFGSTVKKLLKQIRIANQSIGNNALCYFIGFSMASMMLVQVSTLNMVWLEGLENNRFLIVSFLHLVLIGFVSFTLLYHYIINENLGYSKLIQYGLLFWVMGFIFTELLICSQGLYFSFSYTLELILFFSVFMFIGILFIAIKRFQKHF